MKKKLLLMNFLLAIFFAHAQNVGIGTTVPLQKLHVVGNTFLNGNVGIGFSNPAFPLSFSQAVGDKISLWSNSSNSYGFGIQGSLLQIHTDILAADIAFGYGSSSSFTETMRVKGNGNVGIGTTNPAVPLHVNGVSLFTPGGSNIQILAGNNIQAFVNGGLNLTTSSDDPIRFTTFTLGGSSGGERMRILSNGNVGIGTTTPNATALLHVAIGASTSKGLLINGTYNGASTVPDLGAGSRLMFYPGKAAFRAGYVGDTRWDNSNVGLYSTAVGYNTTASGPGTTAMGYITTASGINSTAIGSGTTASGNTSTAMGFSTIASGGSSTAMGYTTTAAGAFSTAIGANDFANSDYSVAIGESVTANAWISTSIGRHNDPIVTSPTTSWVLTEPLLIVGNGTGAADKTNALAIAKNGNVYVDPSNKNNGTLTGNTLLFGTFNGTGEGISSKRTAGGNQYGLDFYTGSANQMSITNAGNIGIGTTSPGNFKLRTAGWVSSNAGFDLTGANANGKTSYNDDGPKITTNIWAGNAEVDFLSWAYDAGPMAFAFMKMTGASPPYTVDKPNMLMSIYRNGNVGIGTAVPNATLDVNGTTKTINFQMTNGAGANKILQSDGSGNASWVTPAAHYIGESYGGGVVFYVYDNGQHGLISAITDQSTASRWYAGSNTNTMAFADAAVAGKANTVLIIANQGYGDGATYAARVCNEYQGGGYGDWYLPSKYELNLLYLEKSVVGGFNTSEYWSSTEGALSYSEFQFFFDGSQGNAGKNLSLHVRAIRAF